MKRGRLLDHLHLRVRDLERSRRFYAAILDALGIELVATPDHLNADELWIDVGDPASHVHFAFQASDHETVQRWYDAGLSAGGRDNGLPGDRSYHPGYYAAFLLDPDGHNVEAVYHGEAKRSAEAVVISF
jgi:catechol 2,3-dioxygenase-like lactoylglutathione lyase family enzyme